MPGPEVAWLNQEAVLWPIIGYDLYGEPLLGPPQQILVHWDSDKVEWLDPKGNSVMLDATAVVPIDIAVNSRMWFGPLEEWVGTAFVGTGTSSDDEIMEVKKFSKYPDLKSRFFYREVGLLRLRNKE